MIANPIIILTSQLNSVIFMHRILKSISFVALFLSTFIPNAHADDVGITSVRLIQVSDSSYVFETDANQTVIWAIKAPIFPERFTVSEMEYAENEGWIIARVTATTSGEPLNHKDEILLPWARNGVSLTTQWKDGTLGRGFFRRSLDGIHIPMNVLLQVEKTDMEIGRESFMLGLEHIGFGFIHLLLVLALFLVFRGNSVLIKLLWFAFGQGFSLILIEFGVRGFDILFIELLLLLTVLMLSISAAKSKAPRYFSWLLLLLGVLHGLSVNGDLQIFNPDYNQKILSVFMFDAAVDIVQFGFALLLFPIFKIIRTKKKLSKSILYSTGIVSVALMFGIFHQKVIPGETRVVKILEAERTAQNTLPTNLGGQSATNRPQGAVQLTTPIMSYLSVEPFEVRHEILVNAGTAMELIRIEDTWMGSIPEAEQELVKERMLELI